MGLGGVTLRLPVKNRYLFYHHRGSIYDMMWELWYFLHDLTTEQWIDLEQKLLNQVTWVGELDIASEEDQKLCGRKFMERSTIHNVLNMKTLLERAWSSPGFALNMVLEGELRYMIHHKPEDGEEIPDIFEDLDFECIIDFSTRQYLVSHKDVFRTVPLCSREILSTLGNFQNLSGVLSTLEEYDIDSKFLSFLEDFQIDSKVLSTFEKSQIDSEVLSIIEECQNDPEILSTIKECQIDPKVFSILEEHEIDSDALSVLEKHQIDSRVLSILEEYEIDLEVLSIIEEHQIVSEDLSLLEEFRLGSEDFPSFEEFRFAPYEDATVMSHIKKGPYYLRVLVTQ